VTEEKYLRPKTIRDHIRAFLTALVLVLIPFLMLEGLLRIVDPWGIYFFDDMVTMANAFKLDEQRLYDMPDGTYEFRNWTATIENETRVLPAPNADADCRIVLLGDSVTFGYGVNDDETWAYDIALAFPNVEFINTAITAYNSEHVRRTYEMYPDADAYLYSVVYNDWEPTINPARYEHQNDARYMPYIVRYGNLLLHRDPELSASDFTPEQLLVHPQLRRFYADIEVLAADPRVEMIAFQDSVTTLALIGGNYPFYQLEYPHYPISFSDGHVNPEGHDILAERIKPVMQEIIEKHCP
jgi:lysophospholipase L1-like esterase